MGGVLPTKPPTHDPKGRTPAQRVAERRAYHDKRRAKDKPWRSWYSTPEWRYLRAFTLRRDPSCRMCLPLGQLTPSTHADHIKTHMGDWALFTDPENTQGLCSTCHNSVKQKQEQLERARSKA